jgi:SAM-dependent methyltransferase
MYAAHHGNFLTLDFTNFVSIRRTYEDICEYLLPCGRILDFGCGGGYDLLYMAEQHPDKEFWGFDYSEEGIDRAEDQARRLGLKNVRFSVGDILNLDPGIVGDLVILKDAFHHVVDPVKLVADLERRTRRVVLIEPTGFGYPLDYDDLLYRMHDVGRVIDMWIPGPLGEGGEGNGRAEDPGVAASWQQEAPAAKCEPVENRYSPEQIEDFFRGWKLEVKGTLSIFSIWEPWFQSTNFGSGVTNSLALSLYRDLDERLRKSRVDLEAKHLIIYASREEESGRVFDGFARLAAGRGVLGCWRRRRLEAEYSGWQVAYDFIDSLPDARQRAGGVGFIQPGQLRIEGVRRDFLFEHPDSSIEYTFRVPPGAEFRGFLGLNPAAWVHGGGRGVVFRLEVVAGRDRASLFCSAIDPRNRSADRCWHACKVDLSGFAGGVVTVILSTQAPGGDRDFCWSGWGDPVVIAPKREM